MHQIHAKHKKCISHNVLVKVYIQKLDLVQQTVGSRCSGQASGGGLVTDQSQEQVQMVLEKGKVLGVLISEMFLQEIEEAGTMDT